MVLNGKGDQYRISAVTQQKIYEAAQQLNYQPNISARRLRSGGETVLPIIALFWSLDTRTVLINRFLKGIQDCIVSLDQEYEMLIQPYVGTRLHEVRSLLTGTRYNGAIIANATEADEQYLEQSQLMVPVVLYQRTSEKYSCVYVDSFKTGEEVAQLFADRGHRKVGTIVPGLSSKAILLRLEGFISKAKELGMELAGKHTVYGDFSEAGGYQAVQQLLAVGEPRPTAIFSLSDQMAVGALMALNEAGLRVPDDIELMGHDDDDVTRYTIPPLSTVHLPVEEMAAECVSLLTGLMQHKSKVQAGNVFRSHMVLRQSCGGEGRFP